jgi:tetratricopeptide (TPR) repeat protein
MKFYDAPVASLPWRIPRVVLPEMGSKIVSRHPAFIHCNFGARMLRMPDYLLRCAICALALCTARAQEMPSMPEHQHHQDAPEANEKLGKVDFPTSCALGSRAAIERGVALLHSFGYAKAQMEFEGVAKADPKCAMAHWGIAMTQFQELWMQPDDAALKRGVEEMAEARALASPPAKVTGRELAYIDALSAFFDPALTKPEQRTSAYSAKMNALHAGFPDDVEGAAFDALSLLASEQPGDTSLSHEHQALAILVPLFAAHPDHPGLAHYIIHTCDTPSLAAEGLPAAREYAKIAPSSPHALHMPSHIFARLGMWQEDIDSNLASVAASESAEAAHEPGAAHQMHADEFLIYAWLQVGQDDKARALAAKIPTIGAQMAAMPGMDDMKDAGPFFANELAAIYDLEMHHWKAAAALQPVPNSLAFETGVAYWAQGIAAGQLHDANLAASALANLDKSIEELKHSPFAAAVESVQVPRNEVLGWQAYARDHPDEAITFMRKAADQQDKLGQNEVDIPAREMLGDLLLMEHKPNEALVEYRTALKLSPNRLNGLLSAGNAAEQAHHPDDALAFYKAAAQQTHNSAASTRPELAHAVQFANSMVAESAGR